MTPIPEDCQTPSAAHLISLNVSPPERELSLSDSVWLPCTVAQCWAHSLADRDLQDACLTGCSDKWGFLKETLETGLKGSSVARALAALPEELSSVPSTHTAAPGDVTPLASRASPLMFTYPHADTPHMHT